MVQTETSASSPWPTGSPRRAQISTGEVHGQQTGERWQLCAALNRLRHHRRAGIDQLLHLQRRHHPAHRQRDDRQCVGLRAVNSGTEWLLGTVGQIPKHRTAQPHGSLRHSQRELPRLSGKRHRLLNLARTYESASSSLSYPLGSSFPPPRTWTNSLACNSWLRTVQEHLSLAHSESTLGQHGKRPIGALWCLQPQLQQRARTGLG